MSETARKEFVLNRKPLYSNGCNHAGKCPSSCTGNDWLCFSVGLRQSGDKHVREVLSGAGDGIRTRDINLGKVALYQLSYSRSTAATHIL